MYITDIVYLLWSICPTAIVGIIYYCTRIGVSVRKTGRGRAGGGGVEYLTEFFFFAKKCSWGLKTQTKKKIWGGGRKISEFFFPTKIIFRGGGFWGVWGAPRPHAGVARGRKAIYFFL